MSERLSEIVGKYLEKNENGKARLAVTLKCHQITVERWLRSGPPSAEDAYRLAKACGASDDDADTVVRECIAKSQRTAS